MEQTVMTTRPIIAIIAAGLGSIVLASQASSVLAQGLKLGDLGAHSMVVAVLACKFPYVAQTASPDALCVHHTTIPPAAAKSKTTAAPKQPNAAAYTPMKWDNTKQLK
jgi:hypothetical protein